MLMRQGFAAGYAYEIDSIRFVSDGKPVCLKLVSPEAADVCAPGWRDGAQTGLPVYAVQGDGKLTLAPAPDRDGRLFAGGIACRGIWRGRGRAGNQFHTSSEFGLLGFGGGFQYPGCGDFRPAAFGIGKEAFRVVFHSFTDSDLRRITREDAPHLNRHFGFDDEC